MKYFKLMCIAGVVVLSVSQLHAGNVESGSLTPEITHQIRESYVLSSSEQAIINALANNALSDLILNRDFMVSHNDFFTHKIDTKGITDQERSGRCWLFAGLNVLRPKVIKKYKLDDFEFSQSYLFFWDKIEKANTFLEFIIQLADQDVYDRELTMRLKRPISDGGYWAYVVNLIEKYGVIPKSAMPETYQTRHSWVMTSFLGIMLRQGAVELRSMYSNGATMSDLRAKKIDLLKGIYRWLVLNMGEPPTEFVWQYEDQSGNLSKPKKYTPRTFYKEVGAVDIKNYVALMNYPGKAYNTLFELDKARNIFDMADPQYINLDIDLMKEFALKSVLDNEPVWFACDIIMDKDTERGILSTRVFDYESLLGLGITINKEERIKFWESSGNHAMVFVGVEVKEEKPVKWLVEDSHGIERGNKGHWVLYDDWFNEWIYVVIINKKYLPRDMLDIFEQKPIMLPLWDPMVSYLLKSD